jgi:amphi-Trp domain-containing protein
MDLLEMQSKERVSREEAARRLRELADHLAQHNDVEFERDGLHFKAHVPDEVQLKLEFEIEDDGSELEIELTW